MAEYSAAEATGISYTLLAPYNKA